MVWAWQASDPGLLGWLLLLPSFSGCWLWSGLVTARAGGVQTALLSHLSPLAALGRAEVAVHVLPASMPLQSQWTGCSLDTAPGLREEARSLLAACIA